MIVSHCLTFAFDVPLRSDIFGGGGDVHFLLTRGSWPVMAAMFIAFPFNTPVSSTDNRVSSPFNRGIIKWGGSGFRSNPEGWTSGVASRMGRGLAEKAEADSMFTSLASPTAAIKGLAEVGAGGAVATAKAAARRGGAKSRYMPKRQAVIADMSRGVLCPEPANMVATTNAETGRT